MGGRGEKPIADCISRESSEGAPVVVVVEAPGMSEDSRSAEEQVQAAAKIQAGFRGYQVRKRLQEERDHKAKEASKPGQEPEEPGEQTRTPMVNIPFFLYLLESLFPLYFSLALMLAAASLCAICYCLTGEGHLFKWNICVIFV